MRKIPLYTLIVVCCVFVGNFIYCMERMHPLDKQVQYKVITVARNLFLDIFPDTEIEEIMAKPSDDCVNFVYDKLYKIEVMYRKKEKFKRIIFNIGIYKQDFITPSKIELLTLDENAQIITTKEGE